MRSHTGTLTYFNFHFQRLTTSKSSDWLEAIESEPELFLALKPAPWYVECTTSYLLLLLKYLIGTFMYVPS